MRRVQLGSDAPMYANLGRYYEPFEETVAPISALALKSAFPPIPPNKPPPPAPCGDEDPLGGTATPHQLLEDTSPVRHSVRLSQVFRPMSISPAPVLDYLATPASPSGINAEPDVTRIDSRHAEDLKPIDRAKETEEYTEVTGDEYIPAEGANEEEGYTAYGPPNRRGQKSIRHIRERAAPYSLEGNAPNRVHKPRIVTDEDDFPRPSIPNPDSARQQADFNAGKHKWWSQRVLRPLLSASPKPLSKHAILSIIKKDLGLTGDAWKAFHDEHLVRTYSFLNLLSKCLMFCPQNSISQTLTAGAKVGGSKGAVFVRLGRPDQIRGGWWSIGE